MGTMHATMMHLPMSTQLIMRHGARIHAGAWVASYSSGKVRRASFAEIAERAGRFAAALAAQGIRTGDRVATFCWNHQEHLEAYLAVPSMGAVLHTLNIRLFSDQLKYIINHAEDRAIIVDADLLPLLADVLPHCPNVELLVVVGNGADSAKFLGYVANYEALLESAEPLSDWPVLDENSAAVACYTSGTTGDPKGVVYSHKTIFAHSLASMGADTFAISQADRILLMPPMFHANAWGLPYSGWLAGSAFVMPGADLQPDRVRAMIEAERPTFTAMVPTLVNDLLRQNESSAIDMCSFRVIVSGGSAVAPALIDRVRDAWGVPMIQGWGMTETSPLCALSVPPAGTPADSETVWRCKSGRPVPGVEVRLVNELGHPVPNDGKSVGALELRGPWVTGAYHDFAGENPLTDDGWLRTGDVGTIDALGYVQITDRVKDVIKSGGEWISSVELENLLLRNADVVEVAVIAYPDSRWEERPLAIVVPRVVGAVTSALLRRYLTPSVARFWLPEYWAFVDALPRTGVGKVDKRALRKLVADESIVVVKDVSGG